MLIWLHPLAQTLALALSFHVLHLGWARFNTAHLGRQGAVFAWRRHVLLGAVVLVGWALGFAFGLGVAWWSWDGMFMTPAHSRVGLAMLPLIGFGLGSGLYMDRVKARRAALPLAHGLGNALLVLLALWQLYTGAFILRNMVGG